MILLQFVVAIVIVLFIAWLIGGVIKDRTRRPPRRRS
jgi:hypothetical protein